MPWVGSKETRKGNVKIFSVVADTNRVVWKIRNEVLYSYENKGIERILMLLQTVLD